MATQLIKYIYSKYLICYIEMATELIKYMYIQICYIEMATQLFKYAILKWLLS